MRFGKPVPRVGNLFERITKRVCYSSDSDDLASFRNKMEIPRCHVRTSNLKRHRLELKHVVLPHQPHPKHSVVPIISTRDRVALSRRPPMDRATHGFCRRCSATDSMRRATSFFVVVPRLLRSLNSLRSLSLYFRSRSSEKTNPGIT